MGKKRDKAAPSDASQAKDAASATSSMRKAARDAAREAIAAESRAIIELVEAQALEAAAAAVGGDAAGVASEAGKGDNPDEPDQSDKPEKPAKSGEPPKSSKAAKKGRGAKNGKGSKPDDDPDESKAAKKKGKKKGKGAKDAGRPADAAHDHDRVDDDEGSVDFRRLTTEIEGLVELVERHRPEVRRAVFDSYVTAVIEFGATAKDLGLVDIHDRMLEADDAEDDATETGGTGADDDGLVADVVAGPRRRSFEAPAEAAPRGPVREADGLDRTASAPRRARSSVHRGRPGVGVVADAADAPEAPDAPAGDAADVTKASDDVTRGADAAPSSPRRRRRRSTVPTLEELAAADPPRNNDQRNLLIVQSHELSGSPATLDAIRAGYERMGWRVPANLRASLRQSIRRGLLLLADDGESYRPA